MLPFFKQNNLLEINLFKTLAFAEVTRYQAFCEVVYSRRFYFKNRCLTEGLSIEGHC